MSDPLPDVRAGLTSASNAAADALCAGRFLAQRGLSAQDTSDADAGTLSHLAMTGEKDALSKLTKQQKKIVKRAREIEVHVVNKWWDSVSGFEAGTASLEPKAIDSRAHRERRLWVKMRDVPIHSGQADAMWFSNDLDHIIIEDLKSLYGEHDDPDVNMQLRDLAALAFENFNCKTVTVFLTQPALKWKFEDVMTVKYERADLERAHKEMIARVLASNDISSKRTPGPQQCRFCRAAGTSRCPESQKVMTDGMKATYGDATPGERAKMIAFFQSYAKVAKASLDGAKAALKEDPAWATGWTIGKGRKVRSLDDVLAVGQILTDLYPEKFTADQLTACCKLSVPDLEELHATLNGSPDSEQFANLFSHLISEKETDGSLVKVK